MDYKHGIYGQMGQSQSTGASQAATAPVYFGVLPIHLLPDYAGMVNHPLKMGNYAAAQRLGALSDDWEKFSLCEAADAHFLNGIEPIGPIYCINVLNPDTMRTAERKQTTAVFTHGRAVIPGDLTIVKTLEIEGVQYGSEFSAEYSKPEGGVLITDNTGTLDGTVEISFFEADPGKVTESVIIGGISPNGTKTGIQAVSLVYTECNVIPSILCAPGWSDKEAVHAALVGVAQKINGHWCAWVNTDLPVNPGDTVDAAIKRKKEQGYNAEFEAPCWPRARKGSKRYHISTLTTVAMLQTDNQNGGIPCETPSNKPVDVAGYWLPDGAPAYDQSQANDLNAAGVRTISYWAGRWTIWGGHTGAYSFGAQVDPRAVFDCSIRMMYYLLNSFQSLYGSEIDKPMSRHRVESILRAEQERLDEYVSVGQLLYGVIEFSESENSTADMIHGDFRFDIKTTTTPPAKSITAVVAYTDTGVSVLFGEE